MATAPAAPEEMSIADAAEEVGLTPHTLRYYERAGLLAPIERNGSGHRRFSREDLEWLVFVTRLRATGMPIRKVRDYAELVRAGDGNEQERLAILEAHRADVLDQLEVVKSNLELIDYKVGLYRDKLGVS